MYLRRTLSKNFGDDLNTNLLQYIGNMKLDNVNKFFTNPNNQVIYMAIGSVLAWADKNTIVWGSGFLKATDKLKEVPEQICAVRGKLTRDILLKQGINCPEVYGDPALLYPKFYQPRIRKQYDLGIIPHEVDRENEWIDKVREYEGVLIIDVLDPVNKIVNDICSCTHIASSSLHGLIVADAYKIPSLWIQMSNKVLGNGFKFRDYFSSVHRTTTEPVFITPETELVYLVEKFQNYKIQIDLDKLYNACPFKKGE